LTKILRDPDLRLDASHYDPESNGNREEKKWTR